MPQRFTGKVLDNEGKPIIGVKVSLKNSNNVEVVSSLTDKNGFFNLETKENLTNPSLTFTKNNYTIYKTQNPQPTGVYSPQNLNKENIKVIYFEGKPTLNGKNGSLLKINQILTPSDVINIPIGSLVELQFSTGTVTLNTVGTYKIENISKPKASTPKSPSIFRSGEDVIDSREIAGIRR